MHRFQKRMNIPRNFCGVLNLDKPVGLTSRDIVDQVVKLVHPAKVGHAGTLDPLATGVLVICVGHATRLISLAQEGRKRYHGSFLLGQRSDTDDITGNVVTTGDCLNITEEDLKSLLPEFTGRILQIPPQFSAVHVEGRRAYKLARRGQNVELAPRPVDVFSLHVTDFRFPMFELEIECGSGTYIRSIGRDIGMRLGSGAIMTSLRRLAVGPFDGSQAVLPEQLTPETIVGFLQPALTLVSGFRQQGLTHDEVIAIRQGKTIEADADMIESRETQLSPAWDDHVALIGTDGQLMGLGEFNRSTHRLQPRIVFPADD